MISIGQHKRVFEYDGAFKCLDCQAGWGALRGAAPMPAECVPKPEFVYCPTCGTRWHQSNVPDGMKEAQA